MWYRYTILYSMYIYRCIILSISCLEKGDVLHVYVGYPLKGRHCPITLLHRPTVLRRSWIKVVQGLRHALAQAVGSSVDGSETSWSNITMIYLFPYTELFCRSLIIIFQDCLLIEHLFQFPLAEWGFQDVSEPASMNGMSPRFRTLRSCVVCLLMSMLPWDPYITRWWQLTYFLFSPQSLGKWSNLTSIFFSNGLKPSKFD